MDDRLTHLQMVQAVGAHGRGVRPEGGSQGE